METLTPNYHLRKQDEDEFYSETINSDNMNIIDAELKKSEDHVADTDLHVTAGKQDAWDALKTFQTAGGTGTAITLTGVELVDGFQTTFVILASNSGSATTINGKSLYKPGTTTAPKLVAGKAATVWYNSAGGCFFIKASAEGTAVAGDVLAGKTFSNDDDVGITGALSLIGTAGVGDVVSGKTFYNTDAKTVQTGTGANAKRIANGATNISMGYANVTGLLFTPSVIVATFAFASKVWRCVYSNSGNPDAWVLGPTTSDWYAGALWSNIANGTFSFRWPSLPDGTSINWKAFE